MGLQLDTTARRHPCITGLALFTVAETGITTEILGGVAGVGRTTVGTGAGFTMTAFIMEITGIASSSAQVCVMR
jgi:hypothetical protein